MTRTIEPPHFAMDLSEALVVRSQCLSCSIKADRIVLGFWLDDSGYRRCGVHRSCSICGRIWLVGELAGLYVDYAGRRLAGKGIWHGHYELTDEEYIQRVRDRTHVSCGCCGKVVLDKSEEDLPEGWVTLRFLNTRGRGRNRRVLGVIDAYPLCPGCQGVEYYKRRMQEVVEYEEGLNGLKEGAG